MRRLLLAMMTLAAVISMAAPVSAQTVGVVLMHGNTDTPSGTIASLAVALEGAGYPVERPEMCWSYRRKRDRLLLDCLSELEAPIERLSGRGVRAIVVAGMSQGGAGALAFGARAQCAKTSLLDNCAPAITPTPRFTHAKKFWPQQARPEASYLLDQNPAAYPLNSKAPPTVR